VKIPTREYPESYWRRQAPANGISNDLYRERRRQGLSPQEAATRPPRRSFATTPDPNSRRQRCLAAGLSDSAVATWRRRHPEDLRSDDEVIQTIVEHKRQADEREQQRDACAAKGLSYDTIRSRMVREGISFEEALARPIATPQEIGRANAHHFKEPRHV